MKERTLSPYEPQENLYCEENEVLVITIHTSEPMPSENRQIRIYIKPTDVHLKDVAIKTLANFFYFTQNILYRVCEEIIKNDPRHSGKYSDLITEHCELILKSMEFHSNDAIVELSQTQTNLPFPNFENMSLGERAIFKTNQILEVIQTEEDISRGLSEIIPDESNRFHILSAFDDLWPDSESNYEYQIAVGNKKLHKMDPKTKPKIKKALEKEPVPSGKIVYGRLFSATVSKDRVFKIDSPDRTYICRYSKGIEKSIKPNLGEFVSVNGKLLDNNTLMIESDLSIKKIDAIPLTDIKLKGADIHLNKPLDLNVIFDENDRYIIYNNEINLLVESRDLKRGIEEINEQINILWSDYVDEDISRLTESAKKYRNKIISLLKAGL